MKPLEFFRGETKKKKNWITNRSLTTIAPIHFMQITLFTLKFYSVPFYVK